MWFSIFNLCAFLIIGKFFYKTKGNESLWILKNAICVCVCVYCCSTHAIFTGTNQPAYGNDI